MPRLTLHHHHCVAAGVAPHFKREEKLGPLSGFKIVEIAGVGAAPFCGMMLADMGADVLRIDRIGPSPTGLPVDPQFDLLNRNRRSVALDLKKPSGVEAVKQLAARADGLIEGFRPGAMERLGLGPKDLQALNPRLIYGRATGWGSSGPLAQVPGHDINFIAISGALSLMGREGTPPMLPLNLLGDIAGGGLYLAFGVVCALLETTRSGLGQVVDAAMVDGSASLLTVIFGLRAMGMWSSKRGDNIADGGAPWYDVYETKEGAFVAIGAIEDRYYEALLQALGLNPASLPDRSDRSGWPQIRAVLGAAFKSRTRPEWCAALDGKEVCFAPVLSMDEAPTHPHNISRNTFVDVAGVTQPAPAPRFDRTVPKMKCPPPLPGQYSSSALLDWGVPEALIEEMRRSEALR